MFRGLVDRRQWPGWDGVRGVALNRSKSEEEREKKDKRADKDQEQIQVNYLLALTSGTSQQEGNSSSDDCLDYSLDEDENELDEAASSSDGEEAIGVQYKKLENN